MTRPLLALSFGLTIAAALAANRTLAQTAPANCASHEMVVERLATRYGETRQVIGLGSNNTIVEVFASLASGSWTITVTVPDGPTCLVASGQAYSHIAEPMPNTDPPA